MTSNLQVAAVIGAVGDILTEESTSEREPSRSITGSLCVVDSLIHKYELSAGHLLDAAQRVYWRCNISLGGVVTL